MRNYPLAICRKIGAPPTIWMTHNPLKIYEYLEVTQSAELQSDDSILDLGCGAGIWTMALARHCRKAVGVDVLDDAVGAARRYIRNSPLKKRLEFHADRLEALQLPEKSLDHIFSFCVLEHIDNLEKVLAEAKRILRSGGQLHVSVDSLATIQNADLKAKHQRDHHVVQYFTVESLREKLEDAGFEVRSVRPILKGELARREFEKRIGGQAYQYGWFARKELVQRLREEDQRETTNEGVMIVAHALCP
ncbi:MAG: methyltransferase domain-containing protein [Anaerolineales bacterium]|nr:methyltransferase domain-containing protein [Anaerolineales bacterium]